MADLGGEGLGLPGADDGAADAAAEFELDTQFQVQEAADYLSGVAEVQPETWEMGQLEIHQIEDRLVREFGYQPAGARVAAPRLEALTGTVGIAFQEWWQNGTTPKIKVAGYTADRLQTEHSMNMIAALLTLDWLARDPDKARASLRRGHDSVTIRPHSAPRAL